MFSAMIGGERKKDRSCSFLRFEIVWKASEGSPNIAKIYFISQKEQET